MQAYFGFFAMAGFVAFFLLVIRLQKRQQEKLVRDLAQMGFQSLPGFEPDIEHDLQGMIVSKFRRSGPFKKVYRYGALDYDLYRFDVPGNDNHTTRFAMVFKRPLFPAFSVMPNLKLPGFLNGLMKKLLETMIQGALYTEVQVPGRPRFQEKYRLYAKDERALQQAISNDIWDRLGSLPGNLSLQAEGRILLLLELVTKVNTATAAQEETKRMIERADALWGVFRDLHSQHAAV